MSKLDEHLFIENKQTYIAIKTNTDKNTHKNTDKNKETKTTTLPVPNYLYKNEYITSETKQHIYDYLIEMTPLEQKAYLLAFNHLDSSFHITKSNGFKEWLDKKSKK